MSGEFFLSEIGNVDGLFDECSVIVCWSLAVARQISFCTRSYHCVP